MKFRALAEKGFAQVKDAEAILYGLDDIVDTKTVIIVEGEPDKLACEEAGFLNVVSVPNGAQGAGRAAADDSAAFAWIANCAAYLDRAERIVLAGDADEKGRALETELARRLGRERCWRVRWPDGNDAPCKDANATLIEHGAAVVRECIEGAEPYPARREPRRISPPLNPPSSAISSAEWEGWRPAIILAASTARSKA